VITRRKLKIREGLRKEVVFEENPLSRWLFTNTTSA